jgi:glycosyltransferase involved in cell wall biosynthesis
MTLFENLTVDDASSDQTGSRTGQLSPQEQRVRRGPQADILGISWGCCTAVEKAHGDWLLLPPAELTIDDAYINLFMETARQADVVVGSRSKREEHSFFCKPLSWSNTHLIRSLFMMVEHQYQLIRMVRLAISRRMEIGYLYSVFFVEEVLIKSKALGNRLVEDVIDYIPRQAGYSS